MKAAKMLLVFGEMTNESQLASAKDAFLRGIEEMGKRRVDLAEIIDQLSQKDIQDVIELETCVVEILIDVAKAKLLNAVKEGHELETLLIVYVGPVTSPWGHWLLRDGLVAPLDILPTSSEEHCKIVVATMAPCDDWLSVEKKQSSQVTVCNYDVTETIDPIALGLCDFIDAVCRRLKVTPCNIKRPDSMSFLKASQPSVCGFLDKGCSVMPCLFLIDGFSMLFNLGYGRNPEVRHQLKYIAQVDAAFLSHVGYNNILALSSTAQNSDTIKINHLFLPYGVNLNDKTIYDPENPFIVNLNCEISKVLSGFKERGTSVSNLVIKGKSGMPVSATQIKPIQLFHKIGYGSLEMISLAPFEDDPDVKKCSEDLKKGKYFNESQNRPLPTSVSVLLLWKPFNVKIATKRLLYIGSKSQLKKNLPAVVTALYNNNDCLKQADSASIDGLTKKQVPAVRKTPPIALTTTKAVTKVNGTSTEPVKKPTSAPPATVTDKTSRISTSTTDHAKKSGTTASTLNSDKQSRPATASATGIQQKPKDTQTKKSNTTSKIKSVENSKMPETKKTIDIKKSESVKVQDAKKPAAKTKTAGSKPAVKKTIISKLEEVAKNAADVSTKAIVQEEIDVVANGVLDEHSSTDLVIDTLCQGDDIPSEANKMVAVGTVECAITEHGEADFCDDTPEEYSAEQMKEMGLYDDEDEDRSSAPVSDRIDLEDADNNTAAAVSSNIAHLPMEGSFYGKDHFDDLKPQPTVWNEPLGMPPPSARDSTSATKKSTKCATPIHVDCVFVPSDLDKDDLRCLFNNVRFDTAFLQLEKCSDLIKSLDLLIEEWWTEGADKDVTIMPSLEDESTLSWVEENMARLSTHKIKVAPALSRCSILIGGGEGDNSCLGFRCDL